MASLSIASIKRSAKELSRRTGITHTQALEQLAREAGFPNYIAAVRKQGREPGVSPAKHVIFVSAYWRDNSGNMGRETLRLELPAPLSSLDSPAHLTRLAQAPFRMDASDHLESVIDLRSQAEAQAEVLRLARGLLFVGATGLKRARARSGKLRRQLRDMLERDHTSYWVHAATGEEVALDEPYKWGLVEQRVDQLRALGLSIIAPDWPGTYAPGMATPYLVSADAGLIQSMAAALRELPALDGQQPWPGESAPYSPQFISPARAASGRAKRARPKPVVPGRVKNGALPYGTALGGPQALWRPAKRMPLDAHKELAWLLRGLEALSLRDPDHERIGVVKCTLDDWVQKEYPSSVEMPDALFRELYYGGERVEGLGELSPVQAVERVREVLAEHYNDCAPLRAMLRSLATLARHLEADSVGSRGREPRADVLGT